MHEFSPLEGKFQGAHAATPAAQRRDKAEQAGRLRSQREKYKLMSFKE